MSPTYGTLLRRSAAFAVRHPGLWLYGLLISTAGGGGSGDLARIFDREEIDLGPLAPFLTALLVLLLFLGLVLLLLTVLAEGALIYAVHEEESGRRPTSARAAAAGAKSYIRLLVLFAMLSVLLFALLVPLVGTPLLFWKALGRSLVVTLLLILALAPPYLLFALGAIFVFAWAPRAALVGGRGPVGALLDALRVLRHDAAGGFALVLGSMINEVIALTLLVLSAVPFTVIAMILFTMNPLLVLVPGVPFVGLLLLYLGLKGTFNSAYWTLAFLGYGARRAATDAWGEKAGGI